MLKVFISYKRKDFDRVQSFIREIERETGAECWYDLARIESSEQFASVICQAIDNADVFMFVHSSSHEGIDVKSDWTVRELNYALAKKKRVVLVKMDDTPLEDLFLMLFGGTNNIQISDPLQKQKLFADLRTWSGQEPVVAGCQTHLQKEPIKKITPWLWASIAAVCVIVAVLCLWFLLGNQKYPEVSVSTGADKINGFEFVDLGLPSGLKWARCNVGANEPWEFGTFFAWGEVKTKTEFRPSNLKYYVERGDSFSLLKYDSLKNVLDAEDDAASVNLGWAWRMPTKEEAEELAHYCRWERARLKGVLGEKVTGTNGNSIFFPYTGFRYLDEYREEGLSLSFWTSNNDNTHPERAYYLYSGISGTEDVLHTIFEITRYLGTSIRAVTE